MTKPMAFRAAYSDWRLIKTRGVIQVVLEVPLADADAAYNVLGGMPDASRENWFAVAPLKLPPAEKEKNLSEKEPATPQPPSPPAAAKRMDWRDMQPAAQAGIRCADPIFMKFLDETYTPTFRRFTRDPARTVRFICCIESRSELGTNHKARVLWKQLDDEFQNWKLAERVGA